MKFNFVQATYTLDTSGLPDVHIPEVQGPQAQRWRIYILGKLQDTATLYPYWKCKENKI